jgi:S1-C subfamily serine protease
MKMKSMVSLAVAVFVLGINAAPAEAFGSEENIEDLTKKVYPSVVKVEAQNGMRRVATGVVIDKDGHIVTTALITPRNEDFYVITSDGKKVEAEFLGMDSVTHLALIKAKDKKWTPIQWGKAKSLAPGAWVGVISISPEETPAVTQGIVSSVGEESLRLNVWVVPGASGSPVVDREGQMVGLIRGSYSDEFVLELGEGRVVTQSYYFNRAEAPASALAMALPVDVVKKVTTEIKDKGKVERGWLGVQIAENEDGEVEVLVVEKDSPAEEAGLKERDIILEFDGTEVSGTKMVAQEIRMQKPGDSITILIKRDGKEEKLKVKLGEYTRKNIFQEFEQKFPKLFYRKEAKPPKVVIPEPTEPKFFSWVQEGRMYIGVYLQELNPELAEYFGIKEGKGLLVTKIAEDGPADKAGLKVGDVIVKADGKDVKTPERLSRLIQNLEKGDKVKLDIVRDKKEMVIEVEVEEEEGKGFQFFSRDWNKYADAWKNYDKALKQKSKKWEEYYEDASKRMKDYNKKVGKQLEEVRKKYTESMKDAQKKLQYALKRYRCIKV